MEKWEEIRKWKKHAKKTRVREWSGMGRKKKIRRRWREKCTFNTTILCRTSYIGARYICGCNGTKKETIKTSSSGSAIDRIRFTRRHRRYWKNTKYCEKVQNKKNDKRRLEKFLNKKRERERDACFSFKYVLHNNRRLCSSLANGMLCCKSSQQASCSLQCKSLHRNPHISRWNLFIV